MLEIVIRFLPAPSSELLPLAVPHSLEQLHMFPISIRDGQTGCSGLCCRQVSTFGWFLCNMTLTFFRELASDAGRGMDKGGWTMGEGRVAMVPL